LGAQILYSMIEGELIRQEAARREIIVSSPEVQTVIKQSFFYRVLPTATPTPLTISTPAALPAHRAAALRDRSKFGKVEKSKQSFDAPMC